MTTISRTVGAFAAGLALAGGTALWAGGQRESPFHPSLPEPTINDLNGTDHLKGLKGVYVLVEDLPPAAATIGLTKDRLKTATELALRRNGVKVLTEKQALDTRGAPRIYVNVNVTRAAFSIGLHLREAVRLERNPRISVLGATVWDTGNAGTHADDPDFIVKTVEQRVEKFCNDYLKANPK